jgi:serine/threonine protein kinase
VGFGPGATFNGRYVLLDPLGTGGVSLVYRAFDLLNQRYVAIKMLDPAMAADPRCRQKILREAILTNRVRHPSVPRVYDYGEAPQGEGTSIAYVVMELLDGTVLSRYLAHGALPWLDAVRVAAAVADVLAVAHKRGVVHRDVTAENIMITADGARIIDFGVAVTIQTPEPGTYVRSPVRVNNDYAGPGEPADDVYALGVLLHQMVTGQSPVGNLPPTAAAAMRMAPPTPVLDMPQAPRGVAAVCRRCLAKRPVHRPDAATVALDLWALIVPETTRSAPDVTGAGRGPVPGPARTAPVRPASGRPGTPRFPRVSTGEVRRRRG